MKVTKVELKKAEAGTKKLAFGQLVLDDVLVIKNVSVFKGKEDKPFVSMPSYKDKQGEYQDIVFPINKELHNHISTTVLEKFATIS